MFIRSFIAQQLGNPSGMFGRWIMRLLNRENANMNDLTMEQMNLQPREYVLEIGVGGGYLMDKIAATQIPDFIAGIDPSTDVLQIGKKKFSRQIKQGYIELQQASGESLPYSDRFFNKICTVNTIYFWSDPKLVLDECDRVLKPNGKLVICYNSSAFLEESKLTQHGFNAYEVEELESMMETSGFTNISTISANSKNNGLFHCTSGITKSIE